jgi:glyoxylase-like metal-dependent hydrolase (beta-lactamase superfamily II)
MEKTSRRDVLHALGAGTALAGFGMAGARVGYAQTSHRSLASTDLRDGLIQITGAGGNVVASAGRDGLLLVDSGSPNAAESLAALLTERFSVPTASALFNTHWHEDHTGGNDSVVRNETAVIAHENTRLWMSTKFYVDWEDRRYTPRAEKARPNKTFFSSDRQPLEIDFNGERVVYAHLPEAHTDGDVYVWFPKRNVIVAGGALTAKRYPILDYITGGWIGGLMDATEALLGIADDDTLIVPDMGPAQRRADLQEQLRMLGAVRERVEGMALKGRGIDDMIAAQVTKEFDARFGDETGLFIANIYQGLWWNRLRAI